MKSFIEIPENSHFPIQNLPFGIFSTKDNQTPRVGVAIGDQILDLTTITQQFKEFLPELINPEHVFSQGSLNTFMSLGKPIWRATRSFLQKILSFDDDDPDQALQRYMKKNSLIPQKDAKMHLPAEIGDYTDFYSSKEHAINVGIHLPVGYHGRSSSVVVTGTDIIRPCGQSLPHKDQPPVFGPSRKLDFELELAFVVGVGNKLGKPISIENANDHIFGVVLMNDWSAWEYVPLGPFLGKNFGTTISPWIVTLDALEPFLVNGPDQIPKPLPYLQDQGPSAYDINLQVKMKPNNSKNYKTITNSNSKYIYWSFKQQLVHHTSEESRGSLLEITWNGENEIEFENGIKRKFIEDGDEILLEGYCLGDGYIVGFGECSGKILASH
ncbi:13633_t:CDS:2 [Entrophospora sp. SA101]|nr:13633_t:CDS:2 [Entrophospora sp. SA101]